MLAQPLAPTSRSRFAFLIHPRVDIAGDMASVHPLLGRIPNRWYEWLLARIPVRPWVHARVTAEDTNELLGEIIVVPLTPAQLLGRDRKLVDSRIQQALAFAHGRGARLVGLGALTAPATGGGMKLRHRQDIGVTNGNAFTAAATVQAIRKVAATRNQPTIALVGATGSVGAAVTERVAHEQLGGRLILIGRNENRLTALANRCTAATPASTARDMTACRDPDIVVLMTSATEALLRSEHLAANAIVIDDTQPRNTTPDLLAERPDVTLIDGGIVRTPGLLRRGNNIGLPDDTSFACLAETALLALAGHQGHGTLGNPTGEQVSRLQQLADTHAHLGFHLAPPTAFGKPIPFEGWAAA